MREENDINKILKKVYATELDLIESVPEVSLRRHTLLQTLKERLWARHTSAIKVAIVAASFALISATIYYYNFFTFNAYQAMQERANIEAQLQRRSDLIPNLVKSAGNYLNYEKNIFAHIAEIRGAVAGMKTLEKSMEKAGIRDMSVLSKFQAVAEAYPALKASESYNLLMKELSETETKIAESRINYNKIVNYYNSRLQLFPGVIFNTLLLRFKPFPVFESTKAAVPDIQQRPDLQQQPAPEAGNLPAPDIKQGQE